MTRLVVCLATDGEERVLTSMSLVDSTPPLTFLNVSARHFPHQLSLFQIVLLLHDTHLPWKMPYGYWYSRLTLDGIVLYLNVSNTVVPVSLMYNKSQFQLTLSLLLWNLNLSPLH